MKKIECVINTMFGGLFLLLSLLIVSEILLRKIFNVSLQGVDELSGYALAIGATLAFSSALIGRSHMRIDLLYSKYSLYLRNAINLLAILSLTLFAAFLAYVSFQVILETNEYQSTAATAWGTPLIIPQAFWLCGSILFAVIAIFMFIKAITLLVKRETVKLNNEFGPKGVLEELESEVSDFKARQKKQDSNETLNTSMDEKMSKGEV